MIYSRYLLVEVLFEEDGGAVTDSAIYAALCKQIAALFGDFGIAAAKSSLSVKVHSKIIEIFLNFIDPCTRFAN